MAAPTWHERAKALSFRADAFVGGRFVPAASGERFPSVNPATGEVLAEVASCDAADVDAAGRAARTAFESGVWSQAAPAERKRVLLRLAERIRAHRDELALLDSL